MKYFSYITVFGNFNCCSTAKVKSLINFPSSLQFFALNPNIRVVKIKKKSERSLLLMIFLFCSKGPDSFLLINLIITLFLLYLEICKRWQPSQSFESNSQQEFWQMFITTFSRLFSGI